VSNDARPAGGEKADRGEAGARAEEKQRASEIVRELKRVTAAIACSLATSGDRRRVAAEKLIPLTRSGAVAAIDLSIGDIVELTEIVAMLEEILPWLP
jgi:hypothetical protein